MQNPTGDKDRELILHPFSVYDPDAHNITIASAKGASLFTDEGEEILDAISSWWVNLHGHAHPYINEAVKNQLDKLEHVMFAGFTHEPAVNLAERLLKKLGHPFEKIFYSDNGSTAVEVALKLAVQYFRNRGEERNEFIAFENSYHGDTFGSMSVSERDVFVKPFVPMLFQVKYIPVPDAENFMEVSALMETHLQSGKVAGFIFEPLVQGAGGMRMYEPGLLDHLIQLVQDHGALAIADEVMTGFGRTGKWFASHYLRKKPDLICLSKGITGGYLPLGVTAFTHRIAEAFASGAPEKTFYHGHSFTANPLSCTAANASLDLMEKTETWERISEIEKMHRAFTGKIKGHPAVADARSLGTIMALELKDPSEGYFYTSPMKKMLYKFFMDRNILVRPLGNIIYTIPPYCITDKELQRIYAAFESAADECKIVYK